MKTKRQKQQDALDRILRSLAYQLSLPDDQRNDRLVAHYEHEKESVLRSMK